MHGFEYFSSHYSHQAFSLPPIYFHLKILRIYHPKPLKMKFTLPALLSLAALASVSIATTCQGTYDSGVTNRYIVHASGVTDIPGICGGLWDNLKRYGVCAATQTFCGQDGGTEDMRWEFVASAGCDNGNGRCRVVGCDQKCLRKH
ncbi:hypothetical protein BP6252_14050 [Coleophoma cylindrospora]|uniref:Uncharacterized protein n=1 Tax=Coleophoma cylindrospora TaxID=1849047 RepID=A0A3D8Q5I1_9HELO|nr:hypothetical protein BP6252_14050 [Coleophoma cylindrospora]